MGWSGAVAAPGEGKEGSGGWGCTAAVMPQQGWPEKWMLVRLEPHVCSRCARTEAVQYRRLSLSPLMCWEVLGSWGDSSLDAGDEVVPNPCPCHSSKAS